MSDRLSWGAFIGADHTVQKIPKNIPGYGTVNILSLLEKYNCQILSIIFHFRLQVVNIY